MVVAGNPFKEQINLILPYSNGNASFKLMDVTGKTVYSKTISLNGTSSVNLVLQNNLSSGMYILETIINGEKFTQKIVKE